MQSGVSRFSGTVGISTTIPPATSLEIVSGTSTSIAGNATNPGMIKLTANGINGAEATTGLDFQYGTTSNGLGFKLYTDAAHDVLALAARSNSPTWTDRIYVRSSTGNVVIGSGGFPAANTKLLVADTVTFASTPGAVWDCFKVLAAAVITSTGTITALNLASIPTFSGQISSGSAVVISDFYMLRVAAASFSGAASATRSWSLGVDGNTKFGGGQNINGTDVNVAGPYTVLATDYVLEVRRTATAAISLNLPSIATVGNGHIVISKDSGYNAAVNNITLVRNGADTIENVAGNYVQNVTGSAIWLKANATTNNWEII